MLERYRLGILVSSVLSFCLLTSPLVSAGPDGDDGKGKSARERALEWVRDHNAFGPDHQLVKDVKAHLDSLPSGAHGFKFEVGAELVKSGKAATLLGWRGRFWVFELSAEQSAKMAKNVLLKTAMKPLADLGEVRPDFAISRPVFDAGSSLPATKLITGRLPFRKLGRESRGYPSVRLAHWSGTSGSIEYSHYRSKFVGNDKEFKFKFDSPKESGFASGAMLMVIDVVEYFDDARTGKPVVVSNPVAVLVTVSGGGVAGKKEFKILTAEELTKAFLDNEDAARKKYGSLAPVSLQGIVKEVRVSKKGGVMVYLKGATDRLDVACAFEPKDGKKAAKLKVGQKILVAGAGYGNQGREILLGFCKLVAGKAAVAPKTGTDPATAPPVSKLVRGVPAKGLVENAGGWTVVKLEENLMHLADRDYAIRKFPAEMRGGHVLVRDSGQWTRWLGQGEVKLAKDATVYVAVMTEYLGKEKISAAQLQSFMKEGWTLLPDAFETTYPGDENWRWRVLRRTVERGPLSLPLPKDVSSTATIYIFK